jgi:hypothetical protein
MFFLKSAIQQSHQPATTIANIMSSSSNTRNNTKPVVSSSSSAPKPFCKVCRDAGRPESEYTSHFVKDQPGPGGKVVCPILLNQACRICNQNGHTSSYCSQYRSRREEPRREERYIERREPRREEPRREERYIQREPRREEPRREERYIEREPRREERYIEREPRREERYREERDLSFNRLRDDTERREQEINRRDVDYRREQDRRSKPWLQAALKPASAHHSKGTPYAHPHGPRVRLVLEEPALSASKHAVTEPVQPSIDVLAVNLHHTANWGDEDHEAQFNPQKMCEEFIASLGTTTANADEEQTEYQQ